MFRFRFILLFSTAMLALCFTLLFAGDKIVIEKLDDLPRHTYRISGSAVDFIQNREAVLALAAEVRSDLEADLEKYEIPDKTTIQSYYAQLGSIAFLEERYDDYLRYLNMGRELEEKEAGRLVAGLVGESWVIALKSDEADRLKSFHHEFSTRVNALPFEVVEANIKQRKGMTEIMSATFVAGGVSSVIQPLLDKSGGEISGDVAGGLIGAHFRLSMIIPLKEQMIDVYSAYLDANKMEKVDIWEAREVDFDGSEGYTPVTVSIWDSGLDVACYTDQVWANESEVAGNGLDDDNNGFVDDVHGIAYTLHAEKTPEILYPIGDIGEERGRLQSMMKGLDDLTSNIDSEEAGELKKNLSTLQQDEVKPFIEDISRYGSYAHGTHVAGIAAKGNPYIRLLASRLTFDYHMIPEVPSVEQARKDSIMFQETVRYFRDNGVRLVNMSWGGSLASIEGDLETHGVGETPEERKALAREIYELNKAGLINAMTGAPEIFFITSAGNSDNDVEFEEFLPSSFRLDNLISVGAVDQAGDETGFTSFGVVDVYANGFEVESSVPGCDRMRMSGTSQASPNVTNLAAKLLAVNPDLTPLQLRELIVKGADSKMAGERPVTLLNPARSLELVRETL